MQVDGDWRYGKNIVINGYFYKLEKGYSYQQNGDLIPGGYKEDDLSHRVVRNILLVSYVGK